MKRWVFLVALLWPVLSFAQGDTAEAKQSIPSHCDEARLRQFLMANMPDWLGSPETASSHILDVQILADFKRTSKTVYVWGHHHTFYLLSCPIKVTSSDGHVVFGYFNAQNNLLGHVQLDFNPTANLSE